MDTELRRKVAWLIAVRAVISTILLGSAIFARITAPGSFAVDPFFFLIGLTYALTIIWAVSLRFVERHRWLLDLQLAGDALIVSAFIYVTGGITSYFSSLYVLPIVAASTLQFRRGGLMVAALSAILYTGLVVAQYLTASGFLALSVARRRVDRPAAAFGRPVHGRPQPVRVLRGGAPQRIAGQQPAVRGRTARAGVHRDRGSAGVEPARHRQPAERPGDDRSASAHSDVQSRRRSHHRRAVPIGRRAGRSARCCSCRPSS